MFDTDLALLISILILFFFIKDILIILLITCVICILFNYVLDEATLNSIYIYKN